MLQQNFRIASLAVIGLFTAAAWGQTGGGGDRGACNPSHYKPEQFQVAIDRASGIAFIHSPCGWTYIGVVARESIDADIRRSGAKRVPGTILQAEIERQAWLETLRKPPTGTNAQRP